MQAAQSERYHRVEVPFALSGGKFEEVKFDDIAGVSPTQGPEVKYHTPEEEIAYVKLPQ